MYLNPGRGQKKEVFTTFYKHWISSVATYLFGSHVQCELKALGFFSGWKFQYFKSFCSQIEIKILTFTM